MPKSKNYSADEYNNIVQHLPELGTNNIEKLENFAIKINRDVLSLYNFIKRKLDIDLFTDAKTGKIFRRKYYTGIPRQKKEKPSIGASKKIIQFEEKKTGHYSPWPYSNVNIIQWANDLLKD